MAITKEMTIGEVIKRHPEAVEVFEKYGVSCMGCPVALMETVEEGAMVHGLDVEELVKELNAAVEKK